MSESPSAVVFDIGRVLFDWNLRYLFEKLIDKPEQLDWFLAHVLTEEWHYQTDAGRPLDEMVPELSARFPDHAHLVEAYRTRFNETVDRPILGTHALVRRVADAGLPLYALTNFGAEFFAGFRPTEPIFELFADIVVSGEECVAKPDPRIYEICERRFGRAPQDLFFIDDNAANVAAARERGWHAHLFEGAEGLEAELVRRGLLAADDSRAPQDVDDSACPR
ncbi:HAD-IA family hydrolase [Altererythrobacter soli]|uniref:HAD-IA family hydrolase n=1 Tax=Croceibacterium soli TaxID=1739690 RepID=A0A6I4UQ78_9SPHN|nr:HAD-IA family hydrolase [Croceibacterium soli]MXP40586.1 HAD-IA family hydrolase [Croceibacterium soli]